MTSGRNTLCKAERLVSRKLTETLFGGSQSRSFVSYPLRAVYMTVPRSEGGQPVQILISVPKKRFHHAVDRNRVKRQVREAFRRHKHPLCDAVRPDEQLVVAFLWQSATHFPTSAVEQHVVSILRRITEKL